jgi:hypothetical protein
MAQRVTAIFNSREAAESAANALVDLGAEHEHISMLARGDEGMVTTGLPAAAHRGEHEFVEPAREVGDTGAPLTTTDEADAARGAATGAAIGAVAGIAAGLAVLMVPGFGVIMAAGPLSWAIGGALGTAAAGAVVGGVYGGLRDIGIDETVARGYEESLRKGNALLTAIIPAMSEDRVRTVLNEYNAQDISFNEDTATMPPSDYAGTTAATAPLASTPSYNANIAGGEAKRAEGEIRDRAADMTASPLDDLAAKGEKVEGAMEEEFGEAEEAVHERR